MKNKIIETILHSYGIKNTPKKGLVLSILKNISKPINANELHKICLDKLFVDIATIYRTLSQFKEKGIVKEFLDNKGVINYEYIEGKAQHPHFECKECQKVYCLGELSFEDGLYFSNMVKNHTIKDINITFSGLCQTCQ